MKSRIGITIWEYVCSLSQSKPNISTCFAKSYFIGMRWERAERLTLGYEAQDKKEDKKKKKERERERERERQRDTHKKGMNPSSPRPSPHCTKPLITNSPYILEKRLQ